MKARKHGKGYHAINPRKINWRKAEKNWTEGSIRNARKWKQSMTKASSGDYIKGIRGSSGRWAEKFKKILKS